MDIIRTLQEIEDNLFPRLALHPLERAMYYYLFRHTRLVGKETAVFSLVPLAEALGVSEWSSREKIRSLHEKGCLSIEERGLKGHVVRLLLPAEIPGVVPTDYVQEEIVDLDSIDFFRGRGYVACLLERERGRCFYCLKKISSENCVLDHVVPQVTGGDNSYRNIVAACHECNSKKQGGEARDYLRTLYRDGMLSQAEFEERSGAMSSLQAGHLKPSI